MAVRNQDKTLAAVMGVGQTHHRAKREDVSIAGLLREAVDRALEDAQLTFEDIDAVVVGKAPDLFEGVMMPELYLAEALGDGEARRFFDGLSHTNQLRVVLSVEGAKTAETRQRRIDKALTVLRDGRTL